VDDDRLKWSADRNRVTVWSGQVIPAEGPKQTLAGRRRRFKKALRDAMTEAFFLNTYGSPLLQAMVGLGAEGAVQRRIERDLSRETAAAQSRSDLERRFEEGGLEEAVLRALIYVRKLDGAFDERGFRMLKIIRESRKPNERLSLAQFKEIFKPPPSRLVAGGQRAASAVG